MSRKLTRRAALKWLGAGAAFAGLSQVDNRNELTVERHRLGLPRWTADGFKVALLTDLHMDSKSKADRAVRAARMASDERPDVLLLGGDLASTSRPDSVRECHRGLQEILDLGIPTFAVLGNHEYDVRDAKGLISGLQARLQGPRSRLLRNETVEIGGVTVAGVDDGIANRDDHTFLKTGMDKNVLCLFHEPDFVERIDRRASLMLAGHSHGGQVCLPFGVPVHTPRGAKTFIRGYYRQAPVPLYVARGVGTVGPGIRVFCPPEVTILTLMGA
ncbi:MAG: metallophosphoesterase [Armatimonadetes bacterium]|nr:metallophosphoesterase [Armatimonadota bacterium]